MLLAVFFIASFSRLFWVGRIPHRSVLSLTTIIPYAHVGNTLSHVFFDCIQLFFGLLRYPFVVRTSVFALTATLHRGFFFTLLVTCTNTRTDHLGQFPVILLTQRQRYYTYRTFALVQ